MKADCKLQGECLWDRIYKQFCFVFSIWDIIYSTYYFFSFKKGTKEKWGIWAKEAVGSFQMCKEKEAQNANISY